MEARFWDEMYDAEGRVRPHCAALHEKLASIGPEELGRRQQMAERALLELGITFTLKADGREGLERIFPFDTIPRVVSAEEWRRIEAGLVQRVRALNLFLGDVYRDQKILADGVVPRDLVLGAKHYRPEWRGFRPPRGVYTHVVGTDLVRDGDGTIYVLEDNLRCPSGVSYVLENRAIMKRVLPAAFERSPVRPVDDYPQRLLETLRAMSPRGGAEAMVVVLTPGIYNSAYFEHAFLAQQMGVQLCEGRDLFVQGDGVYLKTTRGAVRVDVIYRRIDDDFLDPAAFRPESLLGVRGVAAAYRAGVVALANAIGCGVADDKVIYAFAPKIIRYYLGEDPILPNVPTYVCADAKEREHVLGKLDQYVVKAANESGGYGMLVGPHATEPERREFAERIRRDPRNYIAQPTLALSRVPTLVDGGRAEGRHVDLRPYILMRGLDDVWVVPGGLTRVALRPGSLVVNSSQGGGSKDTWVLFGET